jgi:hypothetical protein
MVRVIIAKYIASGMKYDTGIATGLRAVTEAAKTDHLRLKNRRAIRSVRMTVDRKKKELIVFVQV